jgi:tRNA modification GTPase
MAIVACSTPPGRSGIAIVRLSGENSFRITKTITKNNTLVRKHMSPSLVELVDKKNRVFDQAVITQYLSPNSYTGEDLVEISCHGNPVIVSTILDLCVGAGATIAEPGEFTKKAFLNGKMDLSEAEAVSSVIHAKSLAGVRSGMKNLKGSLAGSVFKIKKSIIGSIAKLEFNLDISEDSLQPNIIKETLKNIENQILVLDFCVENFKESQFFQEGATVVLAGPPNAGKSTLFNALINKNHAIITPEEGTTRDVIEKNFFIKQLPVLLKDTAGVREGKSEAEKRGVLKSKEEILSADVVVMFKKKPDQPQKKHIYVFNKSDIKKTNDIYDICISAKENINIKELKNLIYQKLVGDFTRGEVLLTSKRQLNAVMVASKYLKEASLLLRENNSLELVVEDLNLCIKSLDKITKKTTREDILNNIFSSFCVGK